MLLMGYSLAGLIAAAIIFIGARFLWAPLPASRDFGIANLHRPRPLYRLARREGHAKTLCREFSSPC